MRCTIKSLPQVVDLSFIALWVDLRRSQTPCELSGPVFDSEAAFGYCAVRRRVAEPGSCVSVGCLIRLRRDLVKPTITRNIMECGARICKIGGFTMLWVEKASL